MPEAYLYKRKPIALIAMHVSQDIKLAAYDALCMNEKCMKIGSRPCNKVCKASACKASACKASSAHLLCVVQTYAKRPLGAHCTVLLCRSGRASCAVGHDHLNRRAQRLHLKTSGLQLILQLGDVHRDVGVDTL